MHESIFVCLFNDQTEISFLSAIKDAVKYFFEGVDRYTRGHLKCSIRGTNNQLQNKFINYKFVYLQLFNFKYKFIHLQLLSVKYKFV